MGYIFFDTNSSLPSLKSKSGLRNYSFLKTVADNKQYFSAQEIKGADTSRKLQEYLFFPSSTMFKGYVSQNLLTNYEITIDDINREEIIYGPLEPYVEGHMVRRKPPLHDKIELFRYLP